ncbi:MAG: hypothetical protein ABFR63_05465 [Thermodesulfobacteriota bacterium]
MKIVVIAILLYIGYRLLVSDWRKKKGNGHEDSARNSVDDEPVADVLVEDPVCHKLVPKHQAIRLKVKGKEDIVYFCSEECCNRFVSQRGEEE